MKSLNLNAVTGAGGGYDADSEREDDNMSDADKRSAIMEDVGGDIRSATMEDVRNTVTELLGGKAVAASANADKNASRDREVFNDDNEDSPKICIDADAIDADASKAPTSKIKFGFCSHVDGVAASEGPEDLKTRAHSVVEWYLDWWIEEVQRQEE